VRISCCAIGTSLSLVLIVYFNILLLREEAQRVIDKVSVCGEIPMKFIQPLGDQIYDRVGPNVALITGT
jgi:hypothetical protein